jgi:hypothetical protein
MNFVFRPALLAGFVVITSLSFCAFAQPSNPDIQKGIELGIEQKYDEALSLFSSMKDAFPDHPAGAFFSAAVWQSQMMDFETRQWESEFYQEIDLAIKLAKGRLAQNPNESNMYFFYGAALAYKSLQLGMDKKYLPSIKMAMNSMKELKRAGTLDSSFCDPLLGIGSYQYWRSRITRNFSWLPFFPNRRQEGIALIQKVRDCGVYSKWASLSNLAWIYIEEKDFAAAEECARTGLNRFPASRFFLWPLGEAQFRKGNFPDALATFQTLLESVLSERINNHYNEILLYWKIAQCHYQLEQYSAAEQACEKVLSIEPASEVKNRAQGKKREAQKMRDEIKAKLNLAD